MGSSPSTLGCCVVKSSEMPTISPGRSPELVPAATDFQCIMVNVRWMELSEDFELLVNPVSPHQFYPADGSSDKHTVATLQDDTVRESLAKGWSPPMKDSARILRVVFGGVDFSIDNGQTWRQQYDDLTSGATVTVSAVPLDVPHRFSSIQKAIDATPEGGTVTVGEGIYQERLIINQPVSLVADPDDGCVVLQPPEASKIEKFVIAVGRPMYLAEATATSEISVRGFRINGLSSEIGLMVHPGPARRIPPIIKLTKCTVSNCAEAIHLLAGVHLKIKASEIFNCDDGLIVQGRSQATCHSTAFHEIKRCGAFVRDNGSLLSLKKCIMTRIKGPCLSAWKECDVRVSNSVLTTGAAEDSAFLVKSEANVTVSRYDSEVWPRCHDPLSKVKTLLKERQPDETVRHWYQLPITMSAAKEIVPVPQLPASLGEGVTISDLNPWQAARQRRAHAALAPDPFENELAELLPDREPSDLDIARHNAARIRSDSATQQPDSPRGAATPAVAGHEYDNVRPVA